MSKSITDAFLYISLGLKFCCKSPKPVLTTLGVWAVGISKPFAVPDPIAHIAVHPVVRGKKLDMPGLSKAFDLEVRLAHRNAELLGLLVVLKQGVS